MASTLDGNLISSAEFWLCYTYPDSHRKYCYQQLQLGTIAQVPNTSNAAHCIKCRTQLLDNIAKKDLNSVNPTGGVGGGGGVGSYTLQLVFFTGKKKKKL